MGGDNDDKAATTKADEPLTAAERRLQDFVTILESQVLGATALLANQAEHRAEEAEAVRTRIAATRQQMMASTSAVRSGSPVMLRAFDATDRASAIVTRLDAFARGQIEGMQARASKSDAVDDDVFAAADERAPRGYCDLPGTPQGSAPCELDPDRRAEYRAVVREAVLSAQIGWSAAINALKVEEKLRTKEISFEQRLGELLFGALFGVLGSAVKAGLNRAIDAGKKALTTDGWDYPGQKIGPDADAVTAAKATAGAIVNVGTQAAKEALKGNMSAAALDAEARPTVPADREGFLEALKSAPEHWGDAISTRLPKLFDRDLAALVANLPSKKQLGQKYFEAKITALLSRFQTDVMPVGDTVRTVRVVDAFRRVRTALVTPELARNMKMHGEWRGALLPTSKWTFIRWVSEDMQDMALSKSEEFGHMPEVWSTAEAHRWDSRSYTRFLAWNAVEEQRKAAQEQTTDAASPLGLA